MRNERTGKHPFLRSTLMHRNITEEARMEIKNVKLDDLKAVEKYLLSFPLKPDIYNELKEKFPYLPFIIINSIDEIIFGIDYHHFLKSNDVVYVNTLQINISDKEALFLNINLKEKFTGLNLYEKLVFIRKVIRLAEKSEIYQKTGLDININQELIERLDLLLSTTFQSSFVKETISLKTGLKLCNFQPDNQESLLDLFSKIPFSTSHQLKILEMIEEILFRDKCSIEEIFKKLKIKQYMGMEKPQKRIINEFFKYRNPIYAESEIQWQKEIKSLDLPENIKVTHYPFFERNQLEFTINLKDIRELKILIKRLKS